MAAGHDRDDRALIAGGYLENSEAGGQPGGGGGARR